jgi:NAD+ diphosphatase
MTLASLALARGTVDRATERRDDRQWLEAAWAAPDTRVLVVEGGRALVGPDGGLAFVSPAKAPDGPRFLLGTDDDTVYFGVSGPLPSIEGAESRSLRTVGATLSDRDAGLMTHAVALANWHDSHTHCPRCGTPTVLSAAGHMAVCPADGSQHFPRTDPAVIMLVTDPEDRCLLARNVAWPSRRMSVLAGFVDPGESAEMAVAREVHEETSITVGEVQYLGSQPWPMPRSLMLGYHAFALGGQPIIVDTAEIAEAHWFTREQLLASVRDGELLLPPESSIARRIVQYWYGSELPADAG